MKTTKSWARLVVTLSLVLLGRPGRVMAAPTDGPAARASPPPLPPSSVAEFADRLRLEQLDKMLSTIDEESSRRVFWSATGGIVVGAATIAAGSFAMGRGNISSAAPIVLGGSIITFTGVLGLTLGLHPFRSVYENYRVRRSEMSTAATLEGTEREWQSAAAAERTARLHGGVLLTTVGTVLVGLGAVAVATNFNVLSKSATNDDRNTFGGAFLLLSGTLVADGIQTLLVPGPIEGGWQTYSTLLAPAPPRVSFQVAPLHGGTGAYAGMTLRF